MSYKLIINAYLRPSHNIQSSSFRNTLPVTSGVVTVLLTISGPSGGKTTCASVVPSMTATLSIVSISLSVPCFFSVCIYYCSCFHGYKARFVITSGIAAYVGVVCIFIGSMRRYISI